MDTAIPKIKQEVLDDFSFTNDQLKDFKKQKIQFSGETCWKCRLYVNVPRLKRTWKCFNCRSENDFNLKHLCIPFLSPHAGPTRKRIDAPNSYSSLIHDQYKDVLGGQFW